MTKALVCIMNSPVNQTSYVYKLYGDPDQYAYKFENDTYKDELPIHMNWLRFSGYDFLHCLSIHYSRQIIYFGNNFHERLEYGHFIYKNETITKYVTDLPETNQVSRACSKNLTFEKTFTNVQKFNASIVQFCYVA